jgi:cardiolipin synthase
MDRRSFNLNFEINAIIYNEDFVNEAKGVVEEEISKSMLINEKLKKENIFKRLLETLARLFAPII